MKILFLDIEVSPSLATVWGLFNQNIAINQLIGNSEVLTWVAKWHRKPKMYTGSLSRDGKKPMLRAIHSLLDEADAVVTWNGNGFDLKVLNKEFLLARMAPHAPIRSVDLLQTSRKQFRFTSNKMNYVAQQLGIGSKKEHRGHALWLDCMSGKKSAFKEMLAYNKQDVVLLEKIYERFLPHIKGHPNMGLYVDSKKPVCPGCGSSSLEHRGTATTTAGKYQRYQCNGCGRWSRGAQNLLPPEKRRATLRGV